MQAVGAVALMGLLLAGCQPAASTTPAVAPVRPTEIPVSLTDADMLSPAPTLSPTAPPVRTSLEATDPTTVSLVNGRPTLVEFFAFW
ncbi:MAG TPA: hypothetical protein VFI11_14005 [Anaerolineales bacterium]|nr:hypothetical protein [Anaerolineales bacterium]